MIQELILGVSLGRKLHIGRLKVEYKALQIGIAKGHNLNDLILRLDPTNLLNADPIRKNKPHSLPLHILNRPQRVQYLPTQILHTSSLIEHVLFGQTKNREILDDGDAVDGRGEEGWAGVQLGLGG